MNRRGVARWLAAAGVCTAATVGVVGGVESKPARPDLVVAKVQLAAPDGAAGSALQVEATVRNAGKAAAKAVPAEAVLSADGRRDGSDRKLGSLPGKRLKARKRAVVSGRLTVPAGVPAGAYQLLVCADPARKVRESKENNNCKGAPGSFTVVGAGKPGTPAVPGAAATPAPPAPTASPTATPAPTASPGPADTTAPATTITEGPSGLVASSLATFSFTADEPGSTFECSLDAGAFTACASPATYASLGDGAHTFRVRARDAAGNVDATPAERAWSVDTSVPDTAIESGPPALTNSPAASLAFTSPEPNVTFECAKAPAAFSACTSPKEYPGLGEGAHSFSVRARDAAGNVDASPAERAWTVDLTPPETTLISGPSGTVEADSVELQFSSEAGATFQCRVNQAEWATCTSPAQLPVLSSGANTASVRAVDAAGNADPTPASASFTVELPAPAPGPVEQSPPTAAAIAPPLDGTADEPGDLLSFLTTGAVPVQTGVTPGFIQPGLAVLIRGRVLDEAGAPVQGARVTVADTPQLGHTATRADGTYDLVVNAARVVVQFDRKGFISAERQADAGGGVGMELEDVVLVRYDEKATNVDLTAIDGAAVAQSTPVSDADGNRTTTMIVDEGTQATMKVGDQETPLNSITMRATEFTTGADGEKSMPATLPATTAYTYASELSIDEAVKAGADEVTFSKPVAVYVDNFLDFPVGESVPAGSYDRDRGVWVGEDNGRIIKIVSEADGVAAVDTDGNGTADGGLGIDAAERGRLAELYAPGATLWRVPVTHFSIWDFNWNFWPPPDADPPPDPNAPGGSGSYGSKGDKDKCDQPGSVIDCEKQSLGEDVGIPGTPFKLHYESHRGPGQLHSDRVPIEVTGPAPPASLSRVDIKVEVAGRITEHSVDKPPANTKWNFVWDRKDAFGRPVEGPISGRVTIANIFKGSTDYAAVGRFGYWGDGNVITGDRARGEISMPISYDIVVGSWKPGAGDSIGGWQLDVHHNYQRMGGEMFKGDGNDVTSADAGYALKAMTPGVFPKDGAGNCEMPYPNHPDSRPEAAPDGSVYFFDGNSVLCHRLPDGTIEPAPDLGSDTKHWTPSRDGGLLVHQRYGVGNGGPTVAHLYRSSTGERIAGFDAVDDSAIPDGTVAMQRGLPGITAMAEAPDGSIILATVQQPGGLRLLHRLGTDGRYQRIAGGAFEENESTIARAIHLGAVRDLAVEPDGDVLVLEQLGTFGGYYHRIRRITTQGKAELVLAPLGDTPLNDGGLASKGGETFDVVSVSATPTGAVVYGTKGSPKGGQIRAVGLDGRVRTIAGTLKKSECVFGCEAYADQPDVAPWRDGAAATDLPLSTGYTTVDANGTVWTVAYNRLIAVVPAVPGVNASEIVVGDGDVGHVFSTTGRHLRTVHGLTGATLFTFAYNANGGLTSVTDGNGQVVTIQRNGSGVPTAIVAPGGQTTLLTVNAGGQLVQTTTPAGFTHKMGYNPAGLLSSFTDAENRVSSFEYDPAGLLTHDENAEGGSTDISRIQTNDKTEIVATTGEGVTTRYVSERIGGGVTRYRVIRKAGTVETLLDQTGATTVTAEDGTKIRMESAADPRWGGANRYIAKTVMTTPGGRVKTTERTRTVTLSEGGGIATLTERSRENLRTTTTVYDNATRTTTRTTPKGRTATTTIDALGREVSTQTAPGRAPLTRTYDQKGRLVSEGPTGLQTTHTYNDKNERTSTTFPGNRVHTFTHDADSRRIAVTRPTGGGTFTTQLDKEGAAKALVRPNGDRWDLGFGIRGGRKSIDGPGAGAWTWALDGDERVKSGTTPAGGAFTRSFDALGRYTGESRTGEGSIAYEFEGDTSQLNAMTRTPQTGTPERTARTWDGNVPLTVEQQGSAPGTYAYGVEHEGSLVSVGLASGEDAFTDAIGRDEDHAVTQYGPVTFERESADGSVSAYVLGDRRVEVTRDALGRPSREIHKLGDTEVYDVEWTYSLTDGRLLSRIEQVSGAAGATRTYGYDTNGRLATVGGDVSETYTFDAQDNRTSRKEGAAAARTATFVAGDRLTSENGVAYTLDGDGFMTARGADTFTFSRRGELLSATVGAQTVTYKYDAEGRRVSRTLGEETTQYLYGDPGNSLRVTAVRRPDGKLVVLRYDDLGRLLAYERDGITMHVATDTVGTPRVVYDSTGAVVKRIDRDAFGVLRSDSDPSVVVDLGFAGGLQDPLTGLVRFGMRDYDPATGRFATPDPSFFGGSPMNLYSYADGDPIGKSDPTGLYVRCTSLSLYTIVGGGLQRCVDMDTGQESWCLERGAGASGGIDFDFNGQIQNPGRTYFAEASVELPGDTGASDAFEFDLCRGTMQNTVKATVGNYGITAVQNCDAKGCSPQGPAFIVPSVPIPNLGLKAGGKVGVKDCFVIG